MKKGEKIALAIGGLTVLGILAYRRFKKFEKKILEVEKKEEENIKDLNLDPEYFQEEIIPEEDDNNFIKPLYLSVYSNPDFDSSCVVDVIDKKGPLCFLMQSKFWNKKEQEEFNTLDIHLEIPEEQLGVFKMRDFVIAGKDLAKTLWSEKIRFVDEPHQALCGYIILGLAEEPDGELKQRVFRLPEILYSDKRFSENSKSNGLEEFIKAIYNKEEAASEVLERELPMWLNSVLEQPVYGVRFIRAFMTYKISFNIANPSENPNTFRFGVDLKTAISALKYIVNDFKVVAKDVDYRKKGKNSEITYNYLMFNAPDEKGEWSFLNFYDKDDDNHVFIDTCEYNEYQ